MKKLFLLVSAIFLLVAGAFLAFRATSPPKSPPPPSATVSEGVFGPALDGAVIITMRDGKYDPQNPQIKKGATVSFVNGGNENYWPASNIHPTHQIYPGFDPKRPVAPGSTWSFTFDRVGTWRYHDHLNPSITGFIGVEE